MDMDAGAGRTTAAGGPNDWIASLYLFLSALLFVLFLLIISTLLLLVVVPILFRCHVAVINIFSPDWEEERERERKRERGIEQTESLCVTKQVHCMWEWVCERTFVMCHTFSLWGREKSEDGSEWQIVAKWHNSIKENNNIFVFIILSCLNLNLSFLGFF